MVAQAGTHGQSASPACFLRFRPVGFSRKSSQPPPPSPQASSQAAGSVSSQRPGWVTKPRGHESLFSLLCACDHVSAREVHSAQDSTQPLGNPGQMGPAGRGRRLAERRTGFVTPGTRRCELTKPAAKMPEKSGIFSAEQSRRKPSGSEGEG